MTGRLAERSRQFALAAPGRSDGCLVFGVLNVTPDSFSDGGLFRSPRAAVEHGLRMYEQGADVVDVGGESTRPGAFRTSAAEECDRVLEVVAALADHGVVVSIDTMRAPVARAAVAAGASLVNDVSGGRADQQMFGTVAELDVTYILMHWRAPAATMQAHARYTDVVAEVRTELLDQVAAARAAGVAAERIVLDPGLGFAKTAEHNWALLRRLDALVATGWPVLVGASRKRFLGELLADADGTPRPTAHRESATTAVTALAAYHGAWAVRVHDAAAAADAVRVSRCWTSSDGPGRRR
jgi:dihydropteroate synthase